MKLSGRKWIFLVVPLASMGAIAVADTVETSSKMATDAPVFEVPIDCILGKNCFIQQYMDHDSGPGSIDYMCGARSYDGHTGVDIRIPTLAEQRRGVKILAAADGTILSMRNTMPDIAVTPENRLKIELRECGNGVRIDHGGGWESQYCHMARDSVSVEIGQKVTATTPIGKVGLSGDTQFPHLHFSVLHKGKRIDPFSPKAAPNDGKKNCKVLAKSLWSSGAASQLRYHETEYINAGFNDRGLSMEDVEEGKIHPPTTNTPLVFFARAIGLQKGDEMKVTIIRPDGREFSDHSAVMDHNKAQYFAFTGKTRPTEGYWPPGKYTGISEIIRNGKSHLKTRRTTMLN